MRAVDGSGGGGASGWLAAALGGAGPVICMSLSSGRYSRLLPPFWSTSTLLVLRHDLLHRLDVEPVARHLRRLVVLGDDLAEARGIALRLLDHALPVALGLLVSRAAMPRAFGITSFA